ncbi:hypothetical protein Hanom_Chr10g00906641 [Helianthus anomalus]
MYTQRGRGHGLRRHGCLLLLWLSQKEMKEMRGTGSDRMCL